MENQMSEEPKKTESAADPERTTLDQDSGNVDNADASEETSAADEGADELAVAVQERDEFKDKFLRATAEMENLRRRTEKERADLLKYGLENFCKDVLPVMDSFEKALPEEDVNVENSDYKSHLEGMVMLKHQLFQVLEKHGLKAVESAGEPFDPNMHQAIQRIESDEVESETVSQEFARGYLLNGRLVRPAMVSVAVPKKSD